MLTDFCVSTQTPNSNADVALKLARAGAPVFPADPRTKAPLTKRGFKDAQSEMELTRRRWARRPDAIVGLPTGRRTRLFVIDLDRKSGKDGHAVWTALCAAEDRAAYEPQVRTPSGGFHVYFKLPDDVDIRCSQDRLGCGVDVRANGGYVVAAGSIGAAGRYDRIRQTVHRPPLWLLRLVASPQRSAQAFTNRCGAPHGVRALTLDEVADALFAVPNAALDNKRWSNLAYALHAEFGDAARSLFIAYSMRLDPTERRSAEACWRSVSRANRGDLGLGYLIVAARAHGWRDPRQGGGHAR